MVLKRGKDKKRNLTGSQANVCVREREMGSRKGIIGGPSSPTGTRAYLGNETNKGRPGVILHT